MEAEAIWGTDPIHPTPVVYSKIAAATAKLGDKLRAAEAEAKRRRNSIDQRMPSCPHTIGVAEVIRHMEANIPSHGEAAETTATEVTEAPPDAAAKSINPTCRPPQLICSLSPLPLKYFSPRNSRLKM
jgi:hypothetical protein